VNVELPLGSNAITAFYSRNRLFSVSASAAPEVYARTLSVITFSPQSHYQLATMPVVFTGQVIQDQRSVLMHLRFTEVLQGQFHDTGPGLTYVDIPRPPLPSFLKVCLGKPSPIPAILPTCPSQRTPSSR
jgi:hypothetical protein